MKFVVAAVGKLKDPGLEALARDYLKRLGALVPTRVVEVRRTDQLLSQSPRGYEKVALDERGRQMTSAAFGALIEQRMNQGASGMVFWIGAAEGLGQEVRNEADWSLSLSAMTMPHRLVRVVFLEQLYRALSIVRGLPYHKE